MKKIHIILTLFAFVFSTSVSLSKEQYSSYEGTHFMVSFMENEFFIQNESIGVDLRIYISARTWTNIQINYPDGFVYRYRIPKDSVLNVSISNTYYNQHSEEIRRTGIEIITDNPVMVYGFCSQAFSSDSYSCIPTANWGTEYVVMSLPNDLYNPTTPPKTLQDSIIQFTPRPSEFLIIAYHNNTKVTFKPKVETAKGKSPNLYHTITLNKGETYLVQSRDYPKGYGDLSGTLIKADKPIGVLSGHVRTAILQNVPPGKDSKDHIVEMLQPMHTWGKLFFSIPFGTSQYGDFFKITNIEPNTRVKMYQTPFPIEYVLKDSLQYLEIESINTPTIWQSDKPIQIAQFMQRKGDDQESKDYDPAMVILPPREQFVNYVLAATPTGAIYRPNQYTKHYVALLAEKAALDSLFINKKLIDTISPIRRQTILNTDIHWVILPLDPGTYEIYSPTGKFSGILYGLGEYDSYAMVLGSGLLQPELEDNMPPIALVDTNCFKINGRIVDFPGNNSSMVNFARVNDSLTHNVTWNLFNPQPGDTLISFNATIIDIDKPARFYIDFWDKKGNKNTYDYQYEPMKLKFSNVLDFGVMSWSDSLCLPLALTNESEKNITIKSINLPNDPRIRTKFNFTTPRELKPNETLQGEVCFYPNKSLENLKTSIDFNFDCDIIKRTTLLAEVVAPDIEVMGWDFGNVYLGDSAVGEISIKNVGNVTLRIDSLYYYLNETSFTYQQPKYPHWLYPDSTFKVPVTFKPTRRDYFLENVKFANHLKIQNKAIITGKGVAPLFQDVVIDYGGRRIGTTTDTIAKFVNDGNVSSIFKFSKFNYYEDTLEFNYQAIKTIATNIDEMGVKSINLIYSPTDTLPYRLIAEFETDWKLHPPIKLDIRGLGTIPIVRTKKYDFGDVEIFTSKNATPHLLSNTGNEILSIDSVFVIKNTNNAFKIDLSKDYNQKVPIYGTRSWNIEFNPKNLGKHQLLLGVVNDALPNYKRKIDTIVVEGNSIAPPEVNAKIEIKGSNQNVCTNDTVFVEFINLEDFEINLDSIILEITPNSLNYRVLDNFLGKLPIHLPPKTKYTLPIWFIFKLNDIATIKASAIFNKNTFISTIFEKKPPSANWSVVKLEDMAVLPSDTIVVILQGVIDSNIDTPIKLDFSINVLKKILYLVDNNHKLVINRNGVQSQINLQAKQDTNQLELKWMDVPFTFQKGDKWSIELSFIGLLDNAGKTPFDVSITPQDCFIPIQTKNTIKLLEVCMNPMRQIIIVDDAPQMKVYPNPANNLVKIELNLNKNSYIYISIFDIFGKEIVLKEKSILSKGNYLLIFVVENMTSGKYFLKTVINDKVEINIINIIR